MIIGLTGLYCAGKNHVAALLEARGFPVLDVDKLGHKALELEKDKIIALFGDTPRTEQLNSRELSSLRREIAQIVFKNQEKLAALEAIVHPVANRLTEEWVAAHGLDADRRRHPIVINAALLHRSSIFSKLEKIIIVKAPLLTRFLRARKRDKLPWREILKRFKNQKDFNKQYLSINAGGNSAEIHIVENCGTSRGMCGALKLEQKIDKIIEGII